ncbi:OmpH family outer membrane protein [Novosphingobium sp.]|uniref:OmpH family outer membrane protein n=1 Tax=Novosphingobium sp. TaxID=1874826 RepID=UPI0035B36CD3
MKTILKTVLGTAMVLALSTPALADKNKDKAVPAPVTAPAPAANGATIVKGIGILNIDAAIANTDAYRLAQQQQQVTYKPQIDQARTRKGQIDAQLKKMSDQLRADMAAKKPDAVLQQEYVAIKQYEDKGNQELEQILAPLALSDAYVKEQIADQLDQAVQNAMAKQGVTLLLHPDAVIARANAYELTDDVIAELNQLIPASKMQLVPPAGWVPRQVREQQQAAQQQQPGAAPAAAQQPAPRPVQPAGPQPDGR